MVYEALECHGGAGYVEESILSRLYREAPLSSIWEGSGNVMCLDVLRALQREPDALPAFRAELETARGGDLRYDVFLDDLDRELLNPNDIEVRARRIVERLALAFQASVLLKSGPDYVSEAFCATRLYTDRGHEFGTLPPGVDQKRIVERATPSF